MSENAQVANPQDATSTPQAQAEELTLEDIYKESGIDTQAAPQQTQQTQVQAPVNQPEKIEVPDPFDVEAHKQYLANLQQELLSTKQSHESLAQSLRAEQQRIAVANLETEIKQASELVAKESGIENVNLATFELNERARTDAKFRALWDARNSSPQAKAALTRALGVVSREISKKYEIKTDPTLVASKKALSAARQSSATTSQDDSDEPAWGSANGVEFQANWERLIRNTN